MMTFKVSHRDKSWVNFELKILDRRKQREYLKKDKSEKYMKQANEFEAKYKIAAQKYLGCKVDALKDMNPGKAYKILKTFTLPTHQHR